MVLEDFGVMLYDTVQLEFVTYLTDFSNQDLKRLGALKFKQLVVNQENELHVISSIGIFIYNFDY